MADWLCPLMPVPTTALPLIFSSTEAQTRVLSGTVPEPHRVAERDQPQRKLARERRQRAEHGQRRARVGVQRAEDVALAGALQRLEVVDDRVLRGRHFRQNEIGGAVFVFKCCCACLLASLEFSR